MTNIALIFPGQGAQEVGMGKEFYETSPEARAVFDSADTVIPGLSGVIFNGPAEKLTSTAFCQPGIFTYSLAALAALKAHPKFQNLTPSFAAGLSLGELSAVAAAGALSFEQTLKLVERRSFFMDEACRQKKGAMAAVIGFSAPGGDKKLLEICREAGCEVANFNSPDQIVITGEAGKVAAASKKIEEAGAKRVIALDVAGAFHSSLMAPAVPEFQAELAKVQFAEPAFPVVANVDGRPAGTGAKIRENLTTQITSPVQWVQTVETMAAAGVTTFLEIGPGTVLKGLIRKINRDLTVINIRTPQDIENIDI